MNVLRKITKGVFCSFLAIDIIIFSGISFFNTKIENEYKIKKGDTLSLETDIPLTAEYDGTKLADALCNRNVGEEFQVDLKAFGIIPVSKVNVEVVDELYVAVLGNPFGMKLYTDGVLVIELSNIETENGPLNPASEAGIKKGDYIISVNGEKVYTNEDISKIVEASNGKEMKFLILRNKKKLTISFSAVISKETNSYKIGLWIRDSTAGIGTLTFYSPSTNCVCGLGHGVCDEDTDELLKINSGEIVSAEIISYTKGKIGSPGELKGKFTYNTIGKIDLNGENGIYSHLNGKVNFSNFLEVGLKQEITDGKAEILCTIDGSEPKLYSCNVKVRGSQLFSKTQNLVVTVTDDELLKKTGGIVQGMSGSPIIQNGKLIGAVTHVLVDDPKTGYGIFAENMLKTIEEISH